MIVLKYSTLGHGLTRVLNPLSGMYGAVKDETGEVVIRPIYTQLHEFDRDRAIAVKNGKYLEVDRYGNEFNDRQEYCDRLDDIEVTFMLKADYCPACYNAGCEFCMGLGFIPLNYDFAID